MPTFTTNYSLPKPNVNSADDEDLWGAQLNDGIDLIDTQMKTNADDAATALSRSQLPVGSLYINVTDDTNPGTLLGYGTWEPFSEGRVLLGTGTGTDVNAVEQTFAEGDAGGEYEHTQTEAELVSHTHEIVTKNEGGGGFNQEIGTSSLRYETEPTGGGEPMPWLPPYIAVNIWVRTV